MLARQIAIGFGVALVLPLLIFYGVSTFAHRPLWNEFHKATAVYNPKATLEERAAIAEKQKAENAAYFKATQVFSLRLLLVSAPLGYLAIFIGAFGTPSGLRTGLIFGGIFSVTNGYWWCWSFVQDWLHFIALLLALAMLAFVAYKQLPSARPSTA